MQKVLNLIDLWASYLAMVFSMPMVKDGNTKERQPVISLTLRISEIILQSMCTEINWLHFINVSPNRVFIKELELTFDVMDKAVEDHEIIDFHDIMFKFTLDSFVE